MAKKLGILIHPGWSHDKNNKEYLDYYKDMSSKYDELLVFLPEISESISKELIAVFSDDLIEYYLTGTNKEDTNAFMFFREKAVKNYLGFLHSVVDGVKKDVPKTVKTKKFTGVFDYGKRKIKLRLKHMLKHMHEHMYKDDDAYRTLFDGDHTWYIEGKEAVDKICDMYDKNDNVTICKFGTIEFVRANLSEVLKDCYGYTDNVNDDFEIEIFGEYYNKCVKAVGLRLFDLGISFKPIKKQSVFDVADHKDYLEEQEITSFLRLHSSERIEITEEGDKEND